MTADAWMLLAVFLVALLALAWPLGRYMAGVLAGRTPRLLAWLAPLEHGCYRLAGVEPAVETGWRGYGAALIAFSLAGTLLTYALQRLQGWLPLNPLHLGAVAPDSAFNTAVSFVTNTNWQGYAGETTMSYLTQMAALTVQNFVSAACGIAVAAALMRGFARHGAQAIGNFWADLTRITLYILLPLSLVFSLLLVGQGVIQNLAPYRTVQTVSTVAGAPAAAARRQVLPMGPVASQEAIKLLGTNGGGVFNANSAHPFENPTALSNLMQMLAIFLIPAGLCFSFGQLVGDRRQGVALLAAMTLLFVALAWAGMAAEQHGNPALTRLGIDQQASALQAGGNMEGKETRFGIAGSMLYVAVTTAASCGAVNAMHDALTPLGGLVPTFLMQLGEVVFGGVGSGLYGMLIFAILAVFIAGLMVGRTPEYLGKKIEVFDMKMTALAILVTPLLVLVLTALALMTAAGRAGIANPGTHGFTEVLYAFTSAANNNGSAFAGLAANTPFYNIATALAMWLGRFFVIVPVLAIAGSLAAKKRLPVGAGTLPTHGPLFVVLLIGVVLLVGALNYVPALALGPVAEHLQQILAH